MTSAPPPTPPSVGPPTWEQPLPPPPGAPARAQLRRSTDKMLGGVCGGLAEYTGVDPLLWRVGAIALAVAGPGVPVYLLLWLLMPARSAGADPRPGALDRLVERRPAGPRSPVPRLTVAALLVVLGVLVMIDRLTGWDPGARGFLGAALLVVGLGLVALGLTGSRRARGGLIAVGALLSVALVASSSVHVDGEVGDRVVHPLTAAEVQSSYDAGIGNTTVDLSDIDLAGASTPVRTHVDGGVGNLRVEVPASADVQVTVDTGLGHVDVLGNGSTDGLYPGTGTASWTDDGRPDLVLTIDAGIGNVEVSRG